MPPARDIRFDYELRPWQSTLSVLVCKDFHNISAQARGLGIPDEDDEDFSACRGIAWEAHFDKAPRPGASRGRWVIAVLPMPKADAGIVAHEATHVALFLCSYHGLPVSADPDIQEVLTYPVGEITLFVLDAQQRYRNLTRRK